MLKRIATSELRVGMYIDEFCGSWMDHPFWRSRFLVKSEHELGQIREHVREVWIDASKGRDVDAGVADAGSRDATDAQVEDSLYSLAEQAEPGAARRSDLAAEFERASKIFRVSRGVVSNFFGEARLGKIASLEAARCVVGEIAESVTRHPSALIGLARLKSADDYTFMHSMAVSALMVALARARGLDEAGVQEAGMAGLMHDVGKAQVPLAVLNKPDTLNDEEWRLMRSHPARGHAMLLDTPGVHDGALDAVLHHHEKIDGSGYPDRLSGESISELARMAAICDVYDAVTSDRPYKSGWEPTTAVRKMAEWRGHFDERIFRCFVRTVGIYPLGSLVRLKSQRLAVVVDHDPGRLLQPVVKVFFSLKSKMHIAPSLLRLDQAQSDRIVACEDPAQYNFKHLRDLWLPPAAAAGAAG